MDLVRPCPNCKSKNLYRSVEVSAGGGELDFLPGLAGMFSVGKFTVVLCRDCGLSRFFAGRKAMDKLKTSKKWKRITATA